MNRFDMSESTAHFTFLGAWGLGVFAAGASIWLGLQNNRGAAAVFLVFALVASAVAWYSRSRYVTLRRKRWQQELAGSDNELNQVLNHTRMNILIEHATGPLHAEQAEDQEQSAQPDAPEGPPLAKR